jgi:hypothetical protein
MNKAAGDLSKSLPPPLFSRNTDDSTTSHHPRHRELKPRPPTSHSYFLRHSPDFDKEKKYGQHVVHTVKNAEKKRTPLAMMFRPWRLHEVYGLVVFFDKKNAMFICWFIFMVANSHVALFQMHKK